MPLKDETNIAKRSFRDKIDVIIKTNPYSIGSVNALEKSIGLSQSALQRYYNENREPSVTVWKRIIRQLHIPKSWWDNPIGDPFIDPFEIYRELNRRMQKLELESHIMQKETALVKLENEELKARIAKLEKLKI